MVDSEGPRSLKRRRHAQGLLQSPACLQLHGGEGAAVGISVVAFHASRIGALLDHVLGVPPGDVRREVGERQPGHAAILTTSHVSPDVVPTQAVNQPRSRALDRVVSTPCFAEEDFAKSLQPERMVPRPGHDGVADEPGGLALQEHRVHEVLLAQQQALPRPLGGPKEGGEVALGLHIDVGVDATLHVQHGKPCNVRTLDARHVIELVCEAREALVHELLAPCVVPKLESPTRV
mmetsp:Transcript_26728/g.67597  ORF Transcript_26728/g.67597 Transcript_26728/m.67597 type:complete len:234 (-) Transcript_26728:596-1297(-)